MQKQPAVLSALAGLILGTIMFSVKELVVQKVQDKSFFPINSLFSILSLDVDQAAEISSNEVFDVDQGVIEEVISKTDGKLEPGELPSAVDGEEYDCDLCSQDWLFIIATGRSGSTTVLEMMNSLPNVYLSGEHRAIRQLANLPGLTLKINAKYSLTKRKKCLAQQYIREVIGSSEMSSDWILTGFKDIHFDNQRYLDLITELFPCGKFIVNYRNDIVAQQGKYFHRYQTLKEIRKENELLRQWAIRMQDQARLIVLEEFSVERFNDIIRWLGFTDCEYLGLSSANSGGFGDDSNIPMKGACLYKDGAEKS